MCEQIWVFQWQCCSFFFCKHYSFDNWKCWSGDLMILDFQCQFLEHGKDRKHVPYDFNLDLWCWYKQVGVIETWIFSEKEKKAILVESHLFQDRWLLHNFLGKMMLCKNKKILGFYREPAISRSNWNS